ncbi:MAG: peptidoglycan bridge formation glycyltransferase FemA/FemB family protein [Bacilli bacterium]|nr:peptidoglycan bridge formation glycyltransferase FemA/FemB family protein [Bacilli bacterium]
MRMIELTKEQFNEFVNNSPYKNYCQTEEYGIVLRETGFEYSFVGYTTNDYEILAAGMFLTKKIGKRYYYAYCPKGFIIDYKDSDLVRRFTRNLIKYYKRKNIIFLKINPEIPIANIDYNNNYNRITNENINILENLKSLGFKKRKETEPLQLLQPKLTALIDLKEYNVDSLEKRFRHKVKTTENKGLELEIADSSKIEILYEFVKNMKDRKIDYYKNFYNTFNKNDQADLLLVKVNYEKYLLGAKKKVEEETIRNEELNKELQNNNSEKVLNEKMNSDKILEEYKQDVIYATQGLRKNEDTYVAGAIVIKYKNKISILIAGVDKNYNNLNPNYFLHHQILEKYKKDYDIADINGIADDFNEESKFSGLNKFKIGFNPTITEYIGELDLIISEWKFKIVEKNNLLSNEFTKKRDTTSK